jgi:hypothetical protein
MFIRFVPFAILAGKPRRINKERLITEPPPESVLIKPARIPAMVIMMISVTDMVLDP